MLHCRYFIRTELTAVVRSHLGLHKKNAQTFACMSAAVSYPLKVKKSTQSWMAPKENTCGIVHITEKPALSISGHHAAPLPSASHRHCPHTHYFLLQCNRKKCVCCIHPQHFSSCFPTTRLPPSPPHLNVHVNRPSVSSANITYRTRITRQILTVRWTILHVVADTMKIFNCLT